VEYERRLADRQEQEARLAARWANLARLRSVTLGLIVGIIWLAEKEGFSVVVSLVALPTLSLVSLVLFRNRALRAWRRATLAVAFYRQRLARQDGCWQGRGTPGTRYLNESHVCAADLDLFGTGSLFELLCTPCSRGGEDTLAAWLCSPAGVEEVRRRQAAVADLSGRLDLREELALLSADLQSDEELSPLVAWALEPPSGFSRGTRRTVAALGGLPLAALVGGLLTGTGLVPFLAILVLARLAGRRLGVGLRDGLNRVVTRGPLFLALAALLARLARERLETPALAGLTAEAECAAHGFRELARLARRTPLAGLLLGRDVVAFSVEAWRDRSGQDLVRWLGALGQAEALCALAGYACDNPTDPFPEVISTATCFEAQGLCHPLLPRDRCVANDVSLSGELQLLMVSGSNMSGKSTLLRCVGINAVLALAGAPVRARGLRLSPLVVGATLRVQDSLQAGRSRFFAEILRVRRLLDLARGEPPLLFLLDELFQGTNSSDRLHGAEGVLRTLIDDGAIGLVTTHDLALTELAGRLAPRAANMHFEDRLEGGQLVFDFRLRPGVVPGGNGLALMRAVGITV
jgi:hypothetical protein